MYTGHLHWSGTGFFKGPLKQKMLQSLINRLRHYKFYCKKSRMRTQEHAVIPSPFHMSSVIPSSHPQYAQLLLVSPKHWLEKRQHMLRLLLSDILACWYVNCSSLLMDQMKWTNSYSNTAYPFRCSYGSFKEIPKYVRHLLFMQHSNNC